MRPVKNCVLFASSLLLISCATPGPNEDDSRHKGNPSVPQIIDPTRESHALTKTSRRNKPAIIHSSIAITM